MIYTFFRYLKSDEISNVLIIIIPRGPFLRAVININIYNIYKYVSTIQENWLRPYRTNPI